MKRLFCIALFFLLFLFRSASAVTEEDIFLHLSFNGTIETWPKNSGSVEPYFPAKEVSYTENGALKNALVIGKNNNPIKIDSTGFEILAHKGAIEIWIALLEAGERKKIKIFQIGGLEISIDASELTVECYIEKKQPLSFTYPENRVMRFPVKGWEKGEWHQIIVSYGKDSFNLFIDGVPVERIRTGTVNPIRLARNFRIGSPEPSPLIAVDEFRLYNRDLSPGEASSAYKRISRMQYKSYTPPSAIVTAVPANAEPVIDGVLSPGEWWKDTTSFGWFLSSITAAYARHQSRIWATYSENSLFIAFQTPLPESDEDSIDIIFSMPSGETLFLKAKPGSTVVMEKGTAETVYACRTGEVWWTGELQIQMPPAAETKIQANFIRNFSVTGFQTSWALLPADSSRGSGTLELTKNSSTVALEPLKITGEFLSIGMDFLCSGRGPVHEKQPFYPRSGYYDDIVTRLTLNEPGEKQHMVIESPWLFTPSFYLVPRIPDIRAPVSEVINSITVSIESRTFRKEYYHAHVPFSYRPLKITADFIAFDQKIVVEADRESYRWGTGTEKVKLELRKQGKEDSLLAETAISEFPLGTGLAEFDVEKFPAGNYLITAYALDKQENVIGITNKEVEKLTEITWEQASVLGKSDRVIPPFAPLERNGLNVRLWGRNYRFGKLALPDSIVTQDVELLSSPIHFEVAVDGETQEFTSEEIVFAASGKDKMSITGSGNSKIIAINTEVIVEYDGMILINLKVIPKAPEISLEKLSLVIPMKMESSEFLEYYMRMMERPDGLMMWEGSGSQNMETEEISLPFKPCIWIHSGEKGLAWYMESEENLYYSGDKFIQSSKGDNTIRINFVGIPVKLEKAISYSFAMHATPVKPRNPALRNLRKGGTGNYLVWYSMRTSQSSSYRSDNYEGLKHFIASGRRQGLTYSSLYQAIDITGYHIPEVLYHTDEFRLGVPSAVSDGVGRIYPGGYLQEALYQKICMRSRFRDMAVFQALYAVENYGADGIYMDNACIRYCTNTRHGCGFVKEGGLNVTYVIHPIRDLYKRIQTLYSSMDRKPKPLLEGVGGGFQPFNSFVDLVSTGEPFNQDLARQLGKGESMDYYKIMDWEKARTEMYGPMGNTVIFLPQFEQALTIAKKPNPGAAEMLRATEGLISILIQHDCLIWDAWCAQGKEAIYKLWKIKDAFGIERADFVPYWENTAFVPEAAGTKIGYYLDGKKILLLVTNPTDAEITEKITMGKTDLNKNRVNIQSKYRQNPVKVQGNTFHVAVPPKNFDIIEISEY